MIERGKIWLKALSIVVNTTALSLGISFLILLSTASADSSRRARVTFHHSGAFEKLIEQLVREDAAEVITDSADVREIKKTSLRLHAPRLGLLQLSLDKEWRPALPAPANGVKRFFLRGDLYQRRTGDEGRVAVTILVSPDGGKEIRFALKGLTTRARNVLFLDLRTAGFGRIPSFSNRLHRAFASALDGADCETALYEGGEGSAGGEVPQSLRSTQAAVRVIELVTVSDRFLSGGELAALEAVNVANTLLPQLGIAVTVVGHISFTASNDPTGSITTAGPLLQEITLTNSIYPILESHYPAADAYHLFTGRDLDGSVVGVAWRNVVCDHGVNFAISQVTSSNSAIVGRIFTHELAHNLGASHDALVIPPTTLMSPSLNSSVSQFSAQSKGEVSSFLASAECLSSGVVTVPSPAEPTPTPTPNPPSTSPSGINELQSELSVALEVLAGARGKLTVQEREEIALYFRGFQLKLAEAMSRRILNIQEAKKLFRALHSIDNLENARGSRVFKRRAKQLRKALRSMSRLLFGRV
ncbi:MAG: hypothetical protein KDD70_05790 [Bdellovibrionales bacterium]|nr:hypothetical protein [Bdellovibrionales bacterium]